MTPPKQFLLIDDNPHDQLLAIEAFEELCPECTLQVASSGREALSLLRSLPERDRPDVVLLDVNMPGMNGFEVLEALKKDPALALIPVVMLSTSSARQDVSLAYTLHASSYVVKASSFDEFLEQIEAFLHYWQRCRLTHV